ncbi:glycosyltransferase family 4 protein [Permianibacter aggregans]|uniref:Glycosyltransferase involved in cell wall biosynthesis n=1 Tax=Permianibacter aggregans TaxID=1510150 RepID=A0A4R6UL66_9GAMM|nr:glycosyltransferase family 4 protein [Permianibacter aggregans]TDQ47621.1 glycosyltransferase involved in cell wall biosynthesis [Permianibacter aggregans]
MTKKLTVIQLLPELQGGGVERGTLEIAKGLVAAGHRSIVISNGGRLVEKLEAEGSEHFALPVHKKSLWSLWQVPRLRKLFDEIRPDIIHARSRMPAWLSYLAWRRMDYAGARFVTTVHGMYSVNAYSKIMTKGEMVIAVSETIEQYIFNHYPDVPADKVVRIYRGIEPTDFPYDFQASVEWRQQWFSQYPQLQGKTVLCLPGRITRLKGHRDFIELVAALRAQGREVFGLIVGGEDPKRAAYADELKTLVNALGLNDAIIFTGHRSDIREIYSVSDIVYSLSNKPESFGRTVLETLALGRPVLAYAHGGVQEILSVLFPDGMVPLADNEALFQRTIHQLDQPKKPIREHPFLLQTMIAQTLAVYQRLTTR